MPSSQTYNTEGIILKRWDYKERDRMIRVLTRDHGKITTRAISVRKHGAKLAGNIEPFIFADFFIARSRTIDIIAGSNPIDSHAQLRQSIEHSALANYFAEVVDRFTEERQQDEELFVHVQSFYSWLNAERDGDAHLLSVYASVVQLLALLGYQLELYECHNCKRLIPQEGSKFLYALWNVECPDCSSQDETIALSGAVIKIARFVNEHPFNEATQLALSQQDWQEFHAFMHSLIDYHLDKPLQSEHVMLSLLTS